LLDRKIDQITEGLETDHINRLKAHYWMWNRWLNVFLIHLVLG